MMVASKLSKWRRMRHGASNCPASRRLICAAAAWAALAAVPQGAAADEGGVSFWLPGTFGSLAATLQQPGWSMATSYYHTSVSAGGAVSAARQITIGRFHPTVRVNLSAHLDADADLFLMTPSYVFETPVLGGQLSVGVVGIYGRNSTTLDGTLTTAIGPFSFTRSGTMSDSRTGIGDLVPQASLRWNVGVHNFMVYGMGGIPVGLYDSNRLSNVGIGHGAIDGGFGYTYFDPRTGRELSAVTGFTHNFKNPSTDYRNGTDWHLDWGVSQFLSPQLHVGVVGYVYQQIGADNGAFPILGDNKSSVAGVGPQAGLLLRLGEVQGYLNAKGYYEFDASRRARGWNMWVTLVISPAAKPRQAP